VAARFLAIVAAVLVLAGCGGPRPPEIIPPLKQPGLARPGDPGQPAPPPPPLPEWFASEDLIVAFAKSGDTAESLAKQYLEKSDKAWMIEDFREDLGEARSFASGQEVVIPRRDWNPPGVYPNGYQLVPILVYHDIRAQRHRLLRIAASTFAEQMDYLKSEGYRTIGLEDFLAHLLGKRQLPKKSVMLTFDDGYKGFLQYAHPLLKKLGFRAVLFIQSDQIAPRPNPSFLSWSDLRELVEDGVVEVQAHSKTHSDLRRTPRESESTYAQRMQAELANPLELLRKQLPRPGNHSEALAYPYGAWDEHLLRYVKQHGYVAGFTVRREANAAFVPLLTINRSQVYSAWTLDEFKENLNTFQQEPILPETAPVQAGPPRPSPSAALSRGHLVARYNDRAGELESRGWLRQALEASKIALTIDPDDPKAQHRRDQLQDRIERETATLMQQGRGLAPSSPLEARRHFLAVLALNPASQGAFEALRNVPPPLLDPPPKKPATPPRFITYTVSPNDTCDSLAALYYCGDPSRCANIEQFNGLRPGAPLPVGRSIKLPEIPGVPGPSLRPDC
jgi:peptidoglycan/xylan/chitin deacetylase (PgdA/CDA1 family)